MNKKKPGSRFLLSCLTGLTVASLLVGTGAVVTSCNGQQLGNGDMGSDAQDPNAVVRIIISPDNDILQVDLNQTAGKTFTVIAVLASGEMVDVTSQATFIVDNPALGTFAANTFTSAMSAANKVDFGQVRATFGGVTGIANLTVAWLRLSGVSQDFFFVLPNGDPPKTQPLQFNTFIQSIDSFFAVDTTGSMDGEISNLVGSLNGTIIPAVQAAADQGAFFGVGAIDDFRISPFGNLNCGGLGIPGKGFVPPINDDEPFILLQPMTANTTLATAGVNLLLASAGVTRGCGGDIPESQMEGLFQIATGVGNVVGGTVNIPAHQVANTLGGVEFRRGAFPVITMITDASFHAKGEGGACGAGNIGYGAVAAVNNAAHTRAETKTALNNICAKVIGVSSEPSATATCIGTNDLIDFATTTGALVPPVAFNAVAGGRPAGCNANQCCTGLLGVGQAPNGQGLCPLVFKVGTDGSGLGNQVVAGITSLAKFAPFTVVTDTDGFTTGDNGAVVTAGHDTSEFIKSIVPLDSMASPPPNVQTPVISGLTFTNVVPGAVVRFTVEAENTFQSQSSIPQVFHATIKILAGGCTDLDQRDVIILVPPLPPQIG